MSERTRLGALVGAMALLALIIAGTSVCLLYSAELRQEHKRLSDEARKRAGNVATAAAVTGNEEAALRSLLEAHGDAFLRFGETGEMVVARRDGERLIYLLASRRPEGSELPARFEDAPEPMQAALRGAAGSMVATDYHGQKVLAGYAPVKGTPYGVVVKVDTSELRQPFLKALLGTVAATILAGALGAGLIWWVVGPMSRRLEQREQLFRGAMDSTFQWYALMKSDGTLIQVNRTAEMAAGLVKEGLLGRKLWEAPAWLVDDAARARAKAMVERAAAGQPVRYQTCVLATSGETIHLDVSIRSLEDSAGLPGFLLLEGRDITEPKQHELELKRANRALRILSTCNQSMIRASSEAELLEGICNTIEAIGGYRLVWVGYARDDEERRVEPVARAGTDGGYLDRVSVVWKDTELGRGAIGTAIRTGRPCMIRDTRSDERFTPWNAMIGDLGVMAVLGLPLRDGDRVFGALGIYSGEPDPFDAEEERLLTELADDLAYGICAFRARAERDAALEGLRSQEATLRGFFESTAVVLSVVALEEDDLVCLLANGRWANVFGGSPSEVAGKSLRELGIGDADREALLPWFLRSREAHRPQNFEFSLSYDGGTRWYQASISPVGPPAGSLFSFAAVDITERQRAEEALRDSEERFRLAFEHAGVGMNIVSLDGRYERVNRSFCQMLGYTEEELVGQHVSLTAHPDDLERQQPFIDRLLAGELPSTRFSGRCLHRDGHVVWTEIAPALLHDRNGRPLHFVAQVLDVSERHEAEEARARAEELLSGVVNSSPDSIFALHAVRGATGAIEDFECVLANAAAQRLTGWTGQPLEGARMRRDAPPHHMESFFPRCVQVVESGQSLEEEFRIERGGRLRWFRIMAMKLGDGVAVSFADITDRKELQQQFLHAQKMEAVGRLAGGMAHDFNNILTAILGLTDLLLLDIEEGTTYRDRVEEIREAAQRAAGLTRQLLVFSRRQVTQPALLPLGEVVRGVERIVRRLIGEDIEFQAVVEENLWPVRADRGQIEQVLMNLAVNARDAMPTGGRLIVEARNVTLDAAYAHDHFGTEPGEYVQLAVTDTGHGMSPEVRARAFEPFFTTKSAGKGTGLGLATVYGIVRQHGGNIWVYSEENSGTTFRIYLPRAAKGEVVALDLPEAARDLGGTETILLVEDDEHVRKLTQQILEQKGYRLVVARDGAEALALLQRKHGGIDLVLSDVVMPRMGGIDLAQQMERTCPEKPLLLMSGYTERGADSQDILAPDTPFLQKPFSRVDLLRAIRRVIEERAEAHPEED